MEAQKTTNTKTFGFTLIEILVAIFIISVCSGIVTYSIGAFNSNSHLERSAKDLKLLIELAQEQSILKSEVIGISINNQGYKFYKYEQGASPFTGIWKEYSKDNIFYYHRFPRKTQASLKIIKSDKVKPAKQLTHKLVITPSTENSQFIIELGLQEKPPLFKILGMENSDIKLVKL